jgi:predicted exporter
MSRTGVAATAIWALAALAAAAVAARAPYTADLSAFLPRAPSAAQRLLIEQLRAGPAARLLIASIAGGDANVRAQLSAALTVRLRDDPAFATVNNGDAASLERDREFLFRNRYLLSEAVTPEHFSVTGLHEAIAASLDALASPEGAFLKELFTRDPTGELLAILDSLGGNERAPLTSAGVWSTRDGREALILTQTRAAGSDTDGQQAAVAGLERAFAAARGELPAAARLTLRLSGPPLFAVEARALIKREVLRLSLVSAGLIVLLLLSVYRSPAALVLGLVPVASGALAGVAAVALGFGVVHGITLGFGVTLIGESVDYSIYLFVQRDPDWRRTLWPTLRLGVLTSIAGFAVLLPSAFPGLAQLGLYSIAGLIAAALVTGYVLPHWLPASFRIVDLHGVGARLAGVLAALRRARAVLLVIPLLAALGLYLHRDALFNHELSALSPVPLAAEDLDAALRADLGAPDTRYMIVATGPSREAALAAAQSLGARLDPLVESGVIGGFESAARYLPPQALQRARQASLPAAGELGPRLKSALAGLPVSAERLAPFVADVERARAAAPLTAADLAGTSFAAAADALLVPGESGWAALLPVAARSSGDLSPEAVRAVRAAVEAAGPGAVLLDLKGETDRLYSDYLLGAARLAVAGLALIVLLLIVALRSAARVARVVTPLILAVLAVAALLTGLNQPLTILHLVGMLLIVAVGSNYALFFDRLGYGAHPGSQPLTLASLAVANLATVLAFGVLATSRVPVLADLGHTVAPGTLLALVFSAMLAAPAARAPAAAGA